MRRTLIFAVIAVAIAAVLVAVVLVYIAQPTFVKAKPPATVGGTALRQSVEAIVSYSPRDVTHPENLDKLADYLAQILRAAGGRVTLQDYRVGSRNYENVIASFGPESGDRVIVGAHYDVADTFPGADDNASGVAGLLALAQSLGKDPPAKRVDLVAYTLEEPPIFRTEQMGSWVHAQSVKEEGATVRCMIAIEMIGYYTDAPGSQQFPAPVLRAAYGDRGNFIVVATRLEDVALLRDVKRAMSTVAGVPVHSINAPRAIPGIDFSDHASYWDHGFPAVMITDSAFYRNPHYHTAADTPDTLDYDRMSIVVQQLDAAVRALAR